MLEPEASPLCNNKHSPVPPVIDPSQEFFTAELRPKKTLGFFYEALDEALTAEPSAVELWWGLVLVDTARPWRRWMPTSDLRQVGCCSETNGWIDR